MKVYLVYEVYPDGNNHEVLVYGIYSSLEMAKQIRDDIVNKCDDEPDIKVEIRDLEIDGHTKEYHFIMED